MIQNPDNPQGMVVKIFEKLGAMLLLTELQTMGREFKYGVKQRRLNDNWPPIGTSFLRKRHPFGFDLCWSSPIEAYQWHVGSYYSLQVIYPSMESNQLRGLLENSVWEYVPSLQARSGGHKVKNQSEQVKYWWSSKNTSMSIRALWMLWGRWLPVPIDLWERWILELNKGHWMGLEDTISSAGLRQTNSNAGNEKWSLIQIYKRRFHLLSCQTDSDYGILSEVNCRSTLSCSKNSWNKMASFNNHMCRLLWPFTTCPACHNLPQPGDCLTLQTQTYVLSVRIPAISSLAFFNTTWHYFISHLCSGAHIRTYIWTYIHNRLCDAPFRYPIFNARILDDLGLVAFNSCLMVIERVMK